MKLKVHHLNDFNINNIVIIGKNTFEECCHYNLWLKDKDIKQIFIQIPILPIVSIDKSKLVLDITDSKDVIDFLNKFEDGLIDCLGNSLSQKTNDTPSLNYLSLVTDDEKFRRYLTLRITEDTIIRR